MYGGLDMVVQKRRLPVLLIVALASIFLIPSWTTAQGIYDYYGSDYYPLTPEQEQHMWYAEAYNFLYGNDECYYAPYSAPEYNHTSYNVPTYNQNTVGQNATNWLNDANIFYLTGSYEKAAESYAKAVNLDPSLSQGWLNLGNTLYFLGRYQASLNAYDAVLRLDPQNTNALAGKMQALSALNDTVGPNNSTNISSTVQ
jgi:tetratricopeptide (TPR) repeat protein